MERKEKIIKLQDFIITINIILLISTMWIFHLISMAWCILFFMYILWLHNYTYIDLVFYIPTLFTIISIIIFNITEYYIKNKF